MECQDCAEQVDEENGDSIVRVKVGRKTLRLCEACAELREEQAEIAGEAESAMREMMEYKGR